MICSNKYDEKLMVLFLQKCTDTGTCQIFSSYEVMLSKILWCLSFVIVLHNQPDWGLQNSKNALIFSLEPVGQFQPNMAQSILGFVYLDFFVSRIFHSYGDVTITSEVLQILTNAQHLWPLSSESSLAFHTYCDTGHPFIVVIPEDRWRSHLLQSV